MVDPSGVVREIINMRAFCRANNLTVSKMCETHNGTVNQHKGWTKF